MEFTTICDRADIGPDSTLTDAEIAARYEKRFGQPIEVSAVTAARDTFWREIRNARRVGTYEWQGGEVRRVDEGGDRDETQ